MINIDPDEEYDLEVVAYYVSFRDNYRCQKCGKKGQQRHHVIPKSMYGPDSPNNIILLCVECHDEVEIAAHLYIEVLQKLIRKSEKKLRSCLV